MSVENFGEIIKVVRRRRVNFLKAGRVYLVILEGIIFQSH